MMKFLRFLINKINSFRCRLETRKQVKNTIELRERKKTDLRRWSSTQPFYEDWNQRTGIMASMIEPGTQVIEFGAGNMVLKSLLPEGCTYTPSDIVQRNSDFVICDLNEPITIDLSIFDTAVFSGVLEYVYDLESVFQQLSANLEQVVLSYSCRDISNANRLENGWLSDYSKKELEKIFRSHQYEIANYWEWRNQSIYNLKKIISN